MNETTTSLTQTQSDVIYCSISSLWSMISGICGWIEYSPPQSTFDADTQRADSDLFYKSCSFIQSLSQ